MKANSYFRRLVALATLTTILLAGAVLSPVAVGWLLSGAQSGKQEDFVVCLFIPTAADWPAHLLSYSLAALFCAGLLAGLLSFLRQWHSTRRTLRALLKLTSATRGTPCKVPSEIGRYLDYVGTDVALAFCYGWRSPRICLSAGAVRGLGEREIEALLLHEYYHLQRRDPLKVMVAQALSSAFFFLPVMREMQRQFLLAKEIEADAYALRRQGSNKPLLGALYKLLLRNGGQAGVRGLAIAGAGESINQRIDYLLDRRLPAGLSTLTIFISSSMIAGTGAILTLTTWAAAANALWQQAHSATGGC